MGLSAYEISFPLLVFNRSHLSHGRERKLSKPTNLTAPASHTKGCRTNHPLPTPSPNTQFTLGLGLSWFVFLFFFLLLTLTQPLRRFCFLQAWKPLIKSESLQQ